jgi:hypothetical protein
VRRIEVAQNRDSRFARFASLVSRLALPAILAVFVVWGIRLLPGWRYQMNPDGTGYLSVAHKYLAGDFAAAVNAYWSPLYSWLLVPLLAVGVEPFLATKILAIVIGAGAILAGWWLMANLGITRDLRVYVSLALTPILLYFGMFVTTPDLLVTAAILLYLAHLTMPTYGDRRVSSVVTGLLAGVCYLAKAYALPFVLVHLTVVNIVALWRDKEHRPRVIRQALSTYIALAVVAGAWGAALTHKYGTFTLGSTAKFNLAWNGPHFKIPMHNGFLAPPDGRAVSGWDDATYTQYETWNPFASPADREHFAQNRARNRSGIVKICEGFTWLLWPIVIAGVVLAGSGAEPTDRRPGLVIVTALLLYPIGYYLLHVEQRFLSIECVLLLMLGAFVIARASVAFRIGPVRRAIAMALLCASFLWSDKWNAEKDPWPMALARYSLKEGWQCQRETKERSEKLASVLPPRTSIASVGNWGETLYLATYLDLSYWGEPKADASPDVIRSQLEALDVQYLFVWGDPARLPFVAKLTDVSAGRVAGLKIYRLTS